MFGFQLYALYHEYFILRDQHLYRLFKLLGNPKIFAGTTVLDDIWIYWYYMTVTSVVLSGYFAGLYGTSSVLITIRLHFLTEIYSCYSNLSFIRRCKMQKQMHRRIFDIKKLFWRQNFANWRRNAVTDVCAQDERSTLCLLSLSQF